MTERAQQQHDNLILAVQYLIEEARQQNDTAKQICYETLVNRITNDPYLTHAENVKNKLQQWNIDGVGNYTVDKLYNCMKYNKNPKTEAIGIYKWVTRWRTKKTNANKQPDAVSWLVTGQNRNRNSNANSNNPYLQFNTNNNNNNNIRSSPNPSDNNFNRHMTQYLEFNINNNNHNNNNNNDNNNNSLNAQNGLSSNNNNHNDNNDNNDSFVAVHDLNDVRAVLNEMNNKSIDINANRTLRSYTDKAKAWSEVKYAQLIKPNKKNKMIIVMGCDQKSGGKGMTKKALAKKANELWPGSNLTSGHSLSCFKFVTKTPNTGPKSKDNSGQWYKIKSENQTIIDNIYKEVPDDILKHWPQLQLKRTRANAGDNIDIDDVIPLPPDIDNDNIDIDDVIPLPPDIDDDNIDMDDQENNNMILNQSENQSVEESVNGNNNMILNQSENQSFDDYMNDVSDKQSDQNNININPQQNDEHIQDSFDDLGEDDDKEDVRAIYSRQENIFYNFGQWIGDDNLRNFVGSMSNIMMDESITFDETSDLIKIWTNIIDKRINNQMESVVRNNETQKQLQLQQQEIDKLSRELKKKEMELANRELQQETNEALTMKLKGIKKDNNNLYKKYKTAKEDLDIMTQTLKVINKEFDVLENDYNILKNSSKQNNNSPIGRWNDGK